MAGVLEPIYLRSILGSWKGWPKKFFWQKEDRFSPWGTGREGWATGQWANLLTWKVYLSLGLFVFSLVYSQDHQ